LPVKNVQISFDEDLLETVDELAASSQQSRSAIVREALKTWVRQREVKNFEEEWIARLKEKPQDPGETEAWAEAESWGDE
jgi:metal-responsive CopG/Arc/MetJ family transcriptional regulator